MKTIHLRYRVIDEDYASAVVCFLCDLSPDFYLISLEEKPENVHMHIMVKIDDELTTSDFRRLRPDLRELCSEEGNGQYSLSFVKDEDSMGRYICKDGNIVCSSMDLTNWIKTSYKKYDKKDFAIELESLRIKFVTPVKSIDRDQYYSVNWLFKEMLKLKIKYNQKINRNLMEQLVLQWYCQQCDEHLENIADNMSNKFFENYILGHRM